MRVALHGTGTLFLMILIAGCSAKQSPNMTSAAPEASKQSPKPGQAKPVSPQPSAKTSAETFKQYPKPAPAASNPLRDEPAPKAAAEESPEPAESGWGSGKAIHDLPAPKATASNKEFDKAVVPESAPGDAKVLLRQSEPEEMDEEMQEEKKEEVADEQPPYTVVKVYYATDRSPLNVQQWAQSLRGGWPKLTGLCAIFTAALMLWRPRRGRLVVRTFAVLLLVTTIVLGGLTVAYQWQPEPTAGRQIDRMYGNDRGELELGICKVSVPREHEVGALESPTVLHLEFREDPERHVVLLGVHPEAPTAFYADLRACIDQTTRKEAFVFVHGYNVGFESAVRRTAQIAYDLKFEGAPIVYSWPSQEGLLSYTVDETNVAWTVPHLKEFLLGVAEKSGAKSVHLVAHSMGNRALTSALRELALERKAECPRFHEVILTAPDIDADVFRRDLAPAIVGAADRVTLYASSNDEALIASRAVHGYRRAGESGDDLVVLPGVDTVDVSDIDTSLIGHSYYGSNSTVLADLYELMQGSKPPDQRRWLKSLRFGALKYWKFVSSQVKPLSPSHEEL